MGPFPSQPWPFPTEPKLWALRRRERAGKMPVGFDTVDFTGILNYFLSEHKSCYSPSWTLGGGGWE